MDTRMHFDTKTLTSLQQSSSFRSSCTNNIRFAYNVLVVCLQVKPIK